MGPKFFEVPMGKKFYQGTVPRIAKSLVQIAEQLTIFNQDRRRKDALDVGAEATWQLLNDSRDFFQALEDSQGECNRLDVLEMLKRLNAATGKDPS